MDLLTTGMETQTLSPHWPWYILTLCFQPWQGCVRLWLTWNTTFVFNIYIFYCSLTCVSINFYRTWYSSGSHLIMQVRAHPSSLCFRPRKSLCIHPVREGRGSIWDLLNASTFPQTWNWLLPLCWGGAVNQTTVIKVNANADWHSHPEGC